MKKILKEGVSVLVQSEMEDTRFYTVVFGKMRRQDRCNCLGVRQYLGQKKNGEPKYRNQLTSCFHIGWARDYWQEGSIVLLCQ